MSPALAEWCMEVVATGHASFGTAAPYEQWRADRTQQRGVALARMGRREEGAPVIALLSSRWRLTSAGPLSPWLEVVGTRCDVRRTLTSTPS